LLLAPPARAAEGAGAWFSPLVVLTAPVAQVLPEPHPRLPSQLPVLALAQVLLWPQPPVLPQSQPLVLPQPVLTQLPGLTHLPVLAHPVLA